VPTSGVSLSQVAHHLRFDHTTAGRVGSPCQSGSPFHSLSKVVAGKEHVGVITDAKCCLIVMSAINLLFLIGSILSGNIIS
jgi:hypothetical protein